MMFFRTLCTLSNIIILDVVTRETYKVTLVNFVVQLGFNAKFMVHDTQLDTINTHISNRGEDHRKQKEYLP